MEAIRNTIFSVANSFYGVGCKAFNVLKSLVERIIEAIRKFFGREGSSNSPSSEKRIEPAKVEIVPSKTEEEPKPVGIRFGLFRIVENYFLPPSSLGPE